MANPTDENPGETPPASKLRFDLAHLAWRSDGELPVLHRFLRFWVLVGRSFSQNRCPIQAAALAYASLLALVPMLAIVISVSSSLLKKQGEEPVVDFINGVFGQITPDVTRMDLGPTEEAAATNAIEQVTGEVPPPTEPKPTAAMPETSVVSGENPPPIETTEAIATRDEVARRINEFVGNIRSGTLGTTGMAALLILAFGMLSRIENTFNAIWGVKRGRRWFARVAQYWAAITLGPILLGVTLALTSSPYFRATKDYVQTLEGFGAWLAAAGMTLLPYAIWSLAFALFYQLMPNTKVHWRASLVGGLVGGCLWQLNNQFSVLYVSRVVTYSRIYGSLGAVPVFMIGLYFAWMILLFGAQIAYAFQNRRSYWQEKQAEALNQRSREFVALRLATRVGSSFHGGVRPPAQSELAEQLGVASRLVSQILEALVNARVLAEIDDNEDAYVPARPLDQITAQDVLQAIRTGQGVDLATQDDEARNRVQSEFNRIGLAERSVAGAITLQTLVQDLGSQREKAAHRTDHPAAPARPAADAAS